MKQTPPNPEQNTQKIKPVNPDAETLENQETRVAHLLSVAADWEPTHEAPDGLAHMALARLDRAKRRTPALPHSPRLPTVWQWSGAVAAMACAVVVVSGRVGEMPQTDSIASVVSEPVAPINATDAAQDAKESAQMASIVPRTEPQPSLPRKTVSPAPRKGKVFPAIAPRRELPPLIRPRRGSFLVQRENIFPLKASGESANRRSVTSVAIKPRPISASPQRASVRVVKSATSAVPPQAVGLEEEMMVVPVLFTETDEATNTLRITPAAVAVPVQTIAQADAPGAIPSGMPPGTVSTE